MQLYQMIRKGWKMVLLAASLLAVVACSGGQGAVASKTSSRAAINAGAIVPAEQIRVGEYMRYYEQDFAEPENEALAFDVQLGNEQMSAQGGVAWLQLGTQARKANDGQTEPLNLSLVIDRSGSMAEPEKMPYVKQSLRLFLATLNQDDIVSLVTYSDSATLLRQAQPVGDGSWIASTVEQIYPDGGTNLHGGLMLGLEQVAKNYDADRNNRVILLTDGIANEGVIDPAQIAADALAYNERGIYVSTIGLGLDFNDGLLSQLAEQGQGGYSYVDSAQEMERVFRERAAGVKERVASDLSLTLVPQPGVRLVELTDLADAPPSEGVNLLLPPVGTGDSAVLLAKFEVDPAAQVETQAGAERALVNVRLRYVDEETQQPVVVEEMVSVGLTDGAGEYSPLAETDVLRNVTIQETAKGMIAIDHLFQSGQYAQALEIAVELESQLTRVADLTGDEQLREDAALMQRYQQTLSQALPSGGDGFGDDGFGDDGFGDDDPNDGLDGNNVAGEPFALPAFPQSNAATPVPTVDVPTLDMRQ